MTRRYPNILWLMTDEQRCDSLGCYGSPWAQTPNIDALAGQGVVFETAVTPAPVCVPARTSVLAGKYPCQTRVWHNDINLKEPTENLMELFRDSGYRTASFGKQHYAGTASAFEHEAGRCLSDHVSYYGYDARYDEAKYDLVKYPGDIYNWIFGGRFPADPSQTSEAEAIGLAKEWLEQSDGDDPFFVRVSFNGPHTPVVPPEPFDSVIAASEIKYPRECEDLPDGCPEWVSGELMRTSSSSVLSREQIKKMRQYYYGEASFLDDLFGQLLKWMDGRGLLDDTIVIFWSDHGTHLGDYGLVQKQTFFEPVVNVPFLFWYPGRLSEGSRIETPVETQSLLPTLLDLAGLPAPGEGYSPSLADALISGNEPESRPLFSEFTLASFRPHLQHEGRLVMVREGDWKLSVCMDPDPHDFALHNLREDPLERANLADEDSCQPQRERLMGLIKRHLENA